MNMFYTKSGPFLVNDMDRIPIFILHCKTSKNTTVGKVSIFGVFLVRISGLNTEIYRANLCIQSKCGKVRSRNIPNTGTFNAYYTSLYQ